jgi:voltage-gated potassium channel
MSEDQVPGLTFGPAADRARRLFEVPVLVAALLVVPVILVEDRATSAVWLRAATVANWVIWGLFLAEFVVVVFLAVDRRRYVRRSWLDLLIIVASFPVWPYALAATRLLRLVRLARVLRLLRLVRVAAVVARGGAAARSVLRSRGLAYLIVITLLIALGVGGIFALVEETPVGDGLWWAIVTLTTVGYGDVTPVTPAGRIAASVLMFLGVGFIAVITATVAARFVGDEGKDLGPELRAIRERLEAMERLLADPARAEPPDGESPGGSSAPS